MDINNIIKKKTKGLIKYLNANKKLFDEIMLNAASLSFYTITSLSSLIIIVSFIIDSFNDNFKVTIIKDLVEIMGITYTGFFTQSFERVKSINIILLISLLLSSSSIINRYNKYCDHLYYGMSKRGYRNKISSILMFLMLIALFLFLLVILVYSSYFIELLFSNNIIGNIINLVLELFIIYCLFVIMLIYFPPVKITLKDVYKESIILTLIVYSILRLFIILFNVLYKYYKIIGLIFVFSVVSYVIFVVHFIICYVLYSIWKKSESIR